VLASEQLVQLGVVELGLERDALLGRLAARVVVVGLLGELEQRLGVVERRLEVAVEAQLALERGLLAGQPLRRFVVVPQVRARRLGLQLVDALAQSVEVKDAPGTR